MRWKLRRARAKHSQRQLRLTLDPRRHDQQPKLTSNSHIRTFAHSQESHNPKCAERGCLSTPAVWRGFGTTSSRMEARQTNGGSTRPPNNLTRARLTHTVPPAPVPAHRPTTISVPDSLTASCTPRLRPIPILRFSPRGKSVTAHVSRPQTSKWVDPSAVAFLLASDVRIV